RWAAVLVPALIWGFAHAAYPNQPFYIRGVEVGIAGVIIGTVMLRAGIFPLLVWHFTVDAVYTSLLLLRSSNAYFVLSGALAACALLLPGAIALVLYVKERGYLPDAGLTNGAVGSCAPPPRVESHPPSSYAPPRTLDVRVAALAITGAALVLMA